MFDEKALRKAIVETWGPAGAHVEVFDMLLLRIADCEQAGRDLLPILGKNGISCPPSFIALDSPASWFESIRHRNIRKELSDDSQA